MTSNKFIEKMYSLTNEVDSNDVAAIYDDWANTYESDIDADLGYAMPARVADMLPKLVPDKASGILDIGCGTGLSGQALHAKGYQNIDGCDLSKQMLAQAEKRNIYRHLFHADLSQPSINVADRHYDAICIVGAFAFGHVPTAALDDVLRISKRSGVVILTTNDHFYEEGSLVKKVNQLEQLGKTVTLACEHGDHLPGISVGGWVFALGKNSL